MTQAGYRISDLNELNTLKESDIARVGKDIYRRDLAKEQAAMKTYTGDRSTQSGNEAFNKSVYAPSIPSPTDITKAPMAEEITSDASPQLPVSSADAIQKSFLESKTASLENQKTNLFNIYKTQADESRTKIDALNKEIEDLNAKNLANIEATKPENLPYYKETSAITEDRLRAAKTASSTLEKNFLDNQNSISELETILTTANAAIETAKNEPGIASAKNYNLTKIQSDAVARVGVIEAVMSARNGQITTAQSLIDNAYTSVNAAKQDALDYYSSLSDFYSSLSLSKENKISLLTADEKKALDNQISLIKGEMEEGQKVKDYIVSLIEQDPNMVEQSGVKLTDTMIEVQSKIAKWQQKYGGVAELMNQYPDAGIRITDTLEQAEAKMKTSKIYQDKVRPPSSGGSTNTNKLLSISEAKSLGVPYGTTVGEAIDMGITPGGEENPVISLYSDVIQEAINAGASTSDEVVSAVQAVASNSDVKLGVQELNDVKSIAENLLSQNQSTVAAAEEVQPEIIFGYGAGNFASVPIEDRIVQLEASPDTWKNKRQISSQLIKDGYPRQAVDKYTQREYGVIDKISSLLFGK